MLPSNRVKLIWHITLALALLVGQLNLSAAPAGCGSCCAKASAKCCCVASNAPDQTRQPLAPAPAAYGLVATGRSTRRTQFAERSLT